KPAPPPDPDTLDAHEGSVFKGLPVARKDVQAVLGGVQAGLAGKLASMAVPALEMAQGQEFADLARRRPASPVAEAHETPRPKKRRPGQEKTGAQGQNRPAGRGPARLGLAPRPPPRRGKRVKRQAGCRAGR